MQEEKTAPSSFLTTPIAIIIAGALISFAIILTNGGLQLPKSGAKAATTPLPQVAGTQANPPPTPPSTDVRVSVDDDPMLGNNDAPVTMIEFSDYECPFCKQSFTQLLPELKKNYIDTGKVKFVYRDLPLPFHDPMATKEALAASCARAQGGDVAYFRFHDEIFKRTTSNGNGLKEDDLQTIARDLRLNSGTFRTCLEKDDRAEIQKDLADANAVGANGTPTFFIGRSSPDGVILGTRIVGAQPYSVFQSVIDGFLE